MSVVRDIPGLGERLIRGGRNALERLRFSENFVLSNQAEHTEIFRDDIMSVRYYHPLTEGQIPLESGFLPVQEYRHKVPLLLVPPLAATSMIFDLLPQRSVVRYFQARGFEVYLVDWGDVTKSHSHLSLSHYVLDWMPMVMKAVTRHARAEEVSCFCYCMGGLLTLMYAAAHDDPPIRNVVTVASPIDVHSSGLAGRALAAAYEPAQLVSKALNISLMDLPARYLHVPGWVNSLVFKMTNPVGSLISSLDLLVNLWDREFVQRHTTMSQWFDDMVDYPGATIQELVVQMGLKNQLAKGRIRIRDRHAEFRNVSCAILAIAGQADKLVKPQAAHHILDIVSSTDKEFCVVSGGHAGVFAGSKAPEETWAISADWLAQRSGL